MHSASLWVPSAFFFLVLFELRWPCFVARIFGAVARPLVVCCMAWTSRPSMPCTRRQIFRHLVLYGADVFHVAYGRWNISWAEPLFFAPWTWNEKPFLWCHGTLGPWHWTVKVMWMDLLRGRRWTSQKDCGFPPYNSRIIYLPERCVFNQARWCKESCLPRIQVVELWLYSLALKLKMGLCHWELHGMMEESSKKVDVTDLIYCFCLHLSEFPKTGRMDGWTNKEWKEGRMNELRSKPLTLQGFCVSVWIAKAEVIFITSTIINHQPWSTKIT